ncbi:CD276 antigen homolog isoform X5 [Ictalurus punctatus]|uniref:CD276 antigen homolog isoform X5 n=1 Tax=Ictalurus punctatus TaxID=7998 RepID=A0A2D0QB54_ICTPU|nr:CD276 antigen homolog isoform X5 [Ictalurus punctatus]
MNVSWIFCFTFLLLIHTVSLQSVPVEGVLGKSVILPCLLERNLQEVYWRYNDSRTVCDISDGKEDFAEQDPAYKDRVTISPSEIKKGNFSITLRKVKESDAGPYTCIAPNIKTVNLELTVKERRTAPGNGDSLRRADGLLTLLLGCALLYSLTF